MSRPGSSRRTAVLLACLALCAPVTRAAECPTVDLEINPVADPSNQSRCRLRISAKGKDGKPRTAEQCRDVIRVKDLLLDTARRLPSFLFKLKDACVEMYRVLPPAPGPQIAEICLGRGLSRVTNGVAQRATFFVVLDLADIDGATRYLEGQQECVQKVARSLLVETLAHELKHFLPEHVDPASGLPYDTGPAVDCANRLMAELNLGVQRLEYIDATDPACQRVT